MGYGIGVLLLGLVGAYWILERSSVHKGEVKRIGQFLAAFMIVVSVIGIGFQVVRMCQAPAGMGGKHWCPFSMKP